MTQEIEILRLAHGGDGVGTLSDGRVVFVPGALPQERVMVELVQQKKRFARGKIVEVLQPSPERVEPPCPHAVSCGGCSLQHLRHEAQLSIKAQAAWSSILKLSKLGDRLPQLAQQFPAPRADSWRTRCTWRVQAHRNGGFMIGFLGSGSSTIVNQQECLVLVPALGNVREVLPGLLGAIHRAQVFVETASQQQVSVTIQEPHWSRNGKKLAQLKEDAKRWQQKHADLVRGVFCDDTLLAGRPGVDATEAMSVWDEEIFGDDVLPSGLFRQTYREQNKRLVSYLETKLKDAGRVLELFSGVGNLSFPLSRGAQAWVAMEGVKVCTKEGNRLAHHHDAKVRFRKRDLNMQDWDEDVWNESWDVVVLDPSRQGAPQVCKSLASWEKHVDRVVYISCESAALGRDLEVLSQVYDVEEIVAFDMFPHTSHVEMVATLVRRSQEV